MEIKGLITQIMPMLTGTSQITGKEWKKRTFVIETFDRFPKKVCFTMFGDFADTEIVERESVTVSFDVESRSYVGKDGIERWSTDARAWKIEPLTGENFQAPQPQPTQVAQPQPQQYGQQPQYAPQQQYQQPYPQQQYAQPAAPQQGGDNLPF